MNFKKSRISIAQGSLTVIVCTQGSQTDIVRAQGSLTVIIRAQGSLTDIVCTSAHFPERVQRGSKGAGKSSVRVKVIRNGPNKKALVEDGMSEKNPVEWITTASMVS